MLHRALFTCVVLLSSFGSSHAALNVAASTSSMGMLAREIGGEQVKVTVLAPPDRDPHSLQVRPSTIRVLRRADLLVAVGAELEVGWLPPAVASAANPDILPGRQGYFEAAAQVPLIQSGLPADRALGDVHPSGNPHVHMDPQRMATVASALAEVLAQLDPTNATEFRARANAFAAAVAARLPDWQSSASGAPGAVLYHKDADYLLERLGVPILGFIEPVPGVPPTARHLKSLVNKLNGTQGIVVYHAYQASDGPDFVAGALGWPTAVLPLEPALDATADDYLDLIDRWVVALASAKPQ